MLAGVQDTWDLQAVDLKPALALALELEHAQMGVLLLYDETSDELFPALGEGLTPEQCAQFAHQRPGIGPFGIAFAEHRRVTVPDALHGDDSDAVAAGAIHMAARQLGFRSMDIIPIADGTRAVGTLALLFRRTHAPSERAARLVEMCAHTMAIALDSAKRRHEADKKRKRVEDLSRAKIHFFARMSHELRTPLQSIAGYVDLLRLGVRGRVTPAQAELLFRVEKSEQLLLSVIDDLITFSRIEVGRIEYHLGPVAVTDAIVAAEMVVSPIAKERSVSLRVDRCDPALCVHADSDKLRQVLVNLLANALKFTPSQGHVHLSSRADDQAVYFTIADTGPGIPPEKLQDIFQPFVQLGVPLLDGLGGSGLGLAISREFAAGMAGEISVESVEGKGATFTLKLKRLPNLVSRMPQASLAAAAPLAPAPIEEPAPKPNDTPLAAM